MRLAEVLEDFRIDRDRSIIAEENQNVAQRVRADAPDGLRIPAGDLAIDVDDTTGVGDVIRCVENAALL